MANLLNIGCGTNFHSDWTNLDLISTASEVQQHDIRQGLPFPDASFDACYSSHVIEHLLPHQAQELLGEAWRVLKPGGAIRVAVPDLETIAKTYLDTLAQVETGAIEAIPNYDWILLELYDQAIRHYSGGEMRKFLSDPHLKNKDFILARIGHEAEAYWKNKDTAYSKSFWSKIRSKNLGQLVIKARVELAKILVGGIAGKEVLAAFEEGLFRQSGEIHRWMYDRFSLRRLLEQVGFVDVRTCCADESRIPNFSRYNLDTLNGRVRKPDSLFIEGLKPSESVTQSHSS